MKKRNKKGFGLVFVILIFSIIMIFTMSILTVSNFSVKSSIVSQNQNKAHYLARSGAETVKRVWESAGSDKPKGKVETIYVNENYDFQLTKPTKVLGTINVSVNPITENIEDIGLGAWKIVSKAEVNGYRSEVVLTSTGSTDIERLNKDYPKATDSENRRIIDLGSGTLLRGHNKSTEHRGDGFNYITFHDEIRGSLKVDIGKNKIIKLDSSGSGVTTNSDRHIAIIARAIFFENTIDLNLPYNLFSRRKGALIVSAETIVFNKDITIYRRSVLGGDLFLVDYGVLGLMVPEGLGFLGKDIKGFVNNIDVPKIIDNERYGSVYFVGNILVHDERNSSISESQKNNFNRLGKRGFFFKIEDKPIIIGDDTNPLSKLIPMNNHNPIDINNLPQADTNPTFFWN